MQYVNSTVLNSANGYRNQLAIVTFIATARTFVYDLSITIIIIFSTTTPVNNATALVASLRARAAMFGFAYNTSFDTLRYLSQIIPSSDTQVFLVSSLDISNAAISGPSGYQFFIIECKYLFGYRLLFGYKNFTLFSISKICCHLSDNDTSND
jgi:hypothetical protein